MSELDRRLVRGSAWLALSVGGSQIVSLVVAAIVAHFVTPSAFGLVALASVAIVALTTLQESGLGLAIIHRRTDVERAAGTAFVFTVSTAIVLYAFAFVLAPWLAHVFRQPRLADVLRVLALVLIVRGLGLVPGAMIERELVFASRAKGELSGALVQALVAIPLAVKGFGVWSLVAGQLAGQGVQTVTFWAVTTLRPSPRLFSFRILRELSRFGRHVTAANIIYFLDTNLDTATVGRVLGSADVGFYNMAWRLASLPANGIGYIIGRVMFPAYATLQHDKAAFREVFLSNVRRVALFSLPVGIGILIAAQPIVIGLFGQRWEPAVAPLQILAVFALIHTFAGVTAPAIQAAGKPQLIVLLNVLHLGVLFAALIILTRRFEPQRRRLRRGDRRHGFIHTCLLVCPQDPRAAVSGVDRERREACGVLGAACHQPSRRPGFDGLPLFWDAARGPCGLRRRRLRRVCSRVRGERARGYHRRLPFFGAAQSRIH